MPREYPEGTTAAQIAAAAQESETKAAAQRQQSMTGHAFAYRHGSCCPHMRIRHRNHAPMTCAGVLLPGEDNAAGQRVHDITPCDCAGWREKNDPRRPATPAPAERTGTDGAADQL